LADSSSYDEKLLLDLVSRSDQKAFTRLVDLYWNKVYSHALAYAKSSPRAQEITQDVFLQVWNKRETLRDVNDFKNFLFIFSKNQIISSMRKKLDDLTGKDPVEMPEDILIPDRQLEYKQAHNKVMEAIEDLPPTRKIVFQLSRLEGLTYDEISQRLNISRNTVKEHIVLALSFIRTYIHTHGDLLITIGILLQVISYSYNVCILAT
jgi:RNA polymerase sigma-70 factor (family 1)